MPREDPSSDARKRPAAPALVLVFSVDTPLLDVIPLPDKGLIIGRHAEWKADDRRLSREHAVVRWVDGRFVVKDLDSRNGTFLDGERVRGEVPGARAHVLRCGYTIFVCVADATSFGEEPSVHTDGVVAGPTLKLAWRQVDDAAKDDGDLLLVTGETGTGKEHLARRFHTAGPRAGGPFVPVSCAGAIDLDGAVQRAAGGVLFLDEVGDLPPAVQAKLLRLVDKKKREADVGVVAATHRDLRTLTAQQQLRTDLLSRLSRQVVHVPPLRQRLEEIPWLIMHTLKARPHASFVEACMVRFWPGNVRELIAEVERAQLAAAGQGAESLTEEHLARQAGMPLESLTVEDVGSALLAEARDPAGRQNK